MSNGLGSAPSPTGEEGFNPAPTPSMAQAIPAQPQEIAHTTAVEAVDFLLYEDYIYQGQYVLDSTMLPGFVFAILSIHPNGGASHQYISYVSKMFNAWVGKADGRARFMANAFNGGSIRVGFLPPNITEAQIRGMSLATLTAYPNQDLDPKNTSWVNFTGNDERNVMFHWTADTPDATKPETFGGYIVFYVAGQLVTGNQQGGEVNLYVEIKGDYHFLQPNPAFNISDGQFAGPLRAEALRNLALQPGCDDGISGSTKLSGVQILTSTTRSLNCGFLYAYGYNGTDPTTYSPSTTWNIPYATNTRALIPGGTQPGLDAPFATLSPGAGATGTIRFYTDPGQTSGQIMLPITNAEITAVSLPTFSDPTNTMPPSNNPGWYLTPTSKDIGTDGTVFPTDRFYYKKNSYGPCTASSGNAMAVLYYPSNVGNPILIANTGLTGFNKPARNDESIVVFVNTYHRTLNMQTALMAESLRLSNGLDPNTTYVYTLRSADTNDPIINMRLWSDGIWSTNAVTSDTLILKPGIELYLQFDRTLPAGSSLPTISRMDRSVLRDYRKAGSRDSTDSRLKAFSAL